MQSMPAVHYAQYELGLKFWRSGVITAIALLWTCLGWAQTPIDAAQFSGQLRLQWDERLANRASPFVNAMPASGALLATELRASGHGLSTVLTLQQQRLQGQATDSRAWVNELVASHDGGAWQFSAGKKMVAWDVGYGFRPNDLVQQEERRTLLSSTPEGRPLLMAEHFSAETAWSLVWVNPTQAAEQSGTQEPALAARLYQRAGAVDWHGFARVGAHTGASVGAAAAWVASDALELHGSAHYRNRAESKALIGGTWTHQSQLSVLAEVWWDGAAQIQRNVYARLAWEIEAWQPSLDLLYTPFDGGRMVTAALLWKGDRVQLQGGLRRYGGPVNALLMQLPMRQQMYLAGAWVF